MNRIWHRPAAWLIPAGVVFAVLVGDILVAKLQIMDGVGNPLHLGDTMQFLLLLAAVVLFVGGTLCKESDERSARGPER